MGMAGLAILLILLLSAVVIRLAWNWKAVDPRGVSLKRLAGLCLFMVLLAVAYAFGTNNGLINILSGAYVFLAAGIFYAALWIDQYAKRDMLHHLAPAIIALSVFLGFIATVEHPYRLPQNINGQNERVEFLGNRGSLRVDQPTAGYINKLKQVALDAGWHLGTPLIDLTGGSPGATVILGGRILATPWLLGRYSGSCEYVARILAITPQSVQRSAWVLTAPQGKRRIPDVVLSDLGFPNGYEAVGEARTGHRDEIQILWKPIAGKPAGEKIVQ